MSLRTRLMLGLVALAGVGLLAADFATYTSLRNYLDQRVAQQLEAARFPLLHDLAEGGEGRPRRGGPGPSPNASYPAGTYGQVRDAEGSVLAETWLGGGDQRERPRLPDRLFGSAAPVEATTLTAPAERSSNTFRVRVERLLPAGFLVTAVPLREMRQTLGRLLAIMLAVGLAVLAGVAATAWWVVRLGLRPLERIGHTAADIAAGDLTRRVEPADTRTEVGRLGVALNAMLAQIETAFAERTASEERLRRFLADASHELRTPLTSIRGYAELFRRGADVRPDDLARSMLRIEQEAERMGVLVDDLLILARLDQGRPLERTTVALAAIAADAVADARAIDPDRAITLDANGPVMLEADEVRLRQVVTNLLSNALNHTPSGTAVEVQAQADGARVFLTVIDHGAGLDPAQATRVFERFYRSDPSRARGTGGVGLGLAIVAAIVQAHGGTVAVTRTPGGGATFRIDLPTTAGSATEDS